MRDDRYLKYEARPVKEGGGRYVVVTLERGPAEEFYGFASEAEARRWIDKQMRIWKPR